VLKLRNESLVLGANHSGQLALGQTASFPQLKQPTPRLSAELLRQLGRSSLGMAVHSASRMLGVSTDDERAACRCSFGLPRPCGRGDPTIARLKPVSTTVELSRSRVGSVCLPIRLKLQHHLSADARLRVSPLMRAAKAPPISHSLSGSGYRPQPGWRVRSSSTRRRSRDRSQFGTRERSGSPSAFSSTILIYSRMKSRSARNNLNLSIVYPLLLYAAKLFRRSHARTVLYSGPPCADSAYTKVLCS